MPKGNRKTKIAKTATQALGILWEEKFFYPGERLARSKRTLRSVAIIFQHQNSVWH
jgi:hypothetical protein